MVNEGRDSRKISIFKAGCFADLNSDQNSWQNLVLSTSTGGVEVCHSSTFHILYVGILVGGANDILFYTR